jgi:hypothetical protein
MRRCSSTSTEGRSGEATSDYWIRKSRKRKTKTGSAPLFSNGSHFTARFWQLEIIGGAA